jgi:hypothetical protein
LEGKAVWPYERHRRVSSVVLLLASLLAGCAIIDPVPIVGYARLQGTVSHSDGSRFGTVFLVYSCGDPEPTWFENSATTDSQGAFDLVADFRPPFGTLPASGTLVCQISALDTASIVARARATTAFSQNPATRPTATFTLVEGQGVP